ncbi:MAG: ABC transporter ATP-binding protein [Actinobacteria bacterium]|nr:ABC transporter ATP-binding protein [Thermoleophilia bacterium]MCB9011494.1 ABC transporter ATP-binding protein [Actinomycetota bacterium]
MTKAFPGVLANDHIDLALRGGEVHCLLGENGAGKSTLMSILSGMVQPDEGDIRVHGEPTRLASPKRAIEMGIGMVYQHTTLVPTLTVLDNLMMGALGTFRLDEAGSRARLAEVAGMLGVDVDPDAETATLALGQQQQIEIIKALWRGSKVLILDEPTSMLTPRGVEELARALERLKGHGMAVVLITHKLHEATSMGDRVTVLKQGRVVGRLEPDELRGRSHDELQPVIVAMMFGEQEEAEPELVELQEHVVPVRGARELPREALLELVDVHVAPRGGELGVRGVDLSVRPGEILGIAGVDGNGQRELAEAIAGQRHVSSGEIRFQSLHIDRLSVWQRERMGLRYVSDDRMGEGTVAALPVGLNLVLKRIGQAPFWRRGSIRHAEIERNAREKIEEFAIRTPGPGTRIGTLSGGNIQKVVLARELAHEPKLVVYNKPTYGLDIVTTRTVRERIEALAAEGVSALVISTDLDELVALCDRIAVISRGRIAGIVENGAGAAQRVGELMVGGQAEVA